MAADMEQKEYGLVVNGDPFGDVTDGKLGGKPNA